MVEKAEVFQLEYQERGTRGFWYPRLNSIIDICMKDIKSISDDKMPEIRVMVEAANHYLLEDISGAVKKGMRHEHIYFLFLMNRKYGMQWNFVLNDWILLGTTVQQYCIEKKIPLYAICTDPQKSRTVMRQKMSFDLDELLKEVPIKEKRDSVFEWFICNLQYHSVKLYYYHPIYEKWQKRTK
jgi:hypothetical protein